jgi:ribosomal protein L28
MKFCPVISEICRGHVHVPKKERKIIIIRRKRKGENNLPHTTFPPARFPSNKKFAYFLQSPYLFTIDQLFPLIVEMFRFNFYRVSLDFSFRNTKLIVVYVIERITTPTRWTPALQQTGSRNLTDQKTLAYTNICSMCIKINKVGKQEVGIWWVQKRFPRYGVPIWSSWPNIRSLPSIAAEKNVTKNVHICSMCIKTN